MLRRVKNFHSRNRFFVTSLLPCFIVSFCLASSKRFPPDGANRGHYRNARIDALTDQIRVEMNQGKRKALCSEVQEILAEDLPLFDDVV